MSAVPNPPAPTRFKQPLHGLLSLALLLPAQWAPAADTSRSESSDPARRTHPRLYCTPADLPRLRALRTTGVHERIWKNMEESAQWCMTQTPRKTWIAPISPDPIYENLYDRFYGIMADLAITEHLAFTYALSGEARYGDATRDWVLASCRAWKREADDEPNGSKAYAVCRLLKGLAVGYDLAFDRFSAAEREEVRAALTSIGQTYFAGYFSTLSIAGPGFHTHHAVVEWGSFGVAALALLDEVPQAHAWLEATIKKFDEHLLPQGLAPDGAQIEGSTFWASTMHYRLFFLDPLRRVTGRDLFKTHAERMNADLALASIATHRKSGYDQDHANVVLEPSYGQLDYYAPILICLAREYRRGICQRLALWDETLGQIQKTRYVTPHGEPLLFELGGYAFLWFDPNVRAEPEANAKLSYHFPSVDEAYLRSSWASDDLLVAVRKGEVVVHAGGLPVLIEPMATREGPGLTTQSLKDDMATATIRCADASGEKTLEIALNRPEQKVTIRRRVPGAWSWWCHGNPTREGNLLSWPQGVRLRVAAGEIASLDPDGYGPPLATGFLKLKLADPAYRKFPLFAIQPPRGDAIVIELSLKE
ncbi:MAG: DUF4962 domain-containing protein [Planctomycetia bacterium]|nr:DUF4962 domain-containing protein [Planctomycetia bacterium]